MFSHFNTIPAVTESQTHTQRHRDTKTHTQ